jgi:hypothetical protein
MHRLDGPGTPFRRPWRRDGARCWCRCALRRPDSRGNRRVRLCGNSSTRISMSCGQGFSGLGLPYCIVLPPVRLHPRLVRPTCSTGLPNPQFSAICGGEPSNPRSSVPRGDRCNHHFRHEHGSHPPPRSATQSQQNAPQQYMCKGPEPCMPFPMVMSVTHCALNGNMMNRY